MHAHMIGSKEVIALNDGEGQFTPDLFPGTEASHIEGLLSQSGLSEITTEFNAFVVKAGDAKLLIDAGCRDVMGPTAGKMPEELAAAGLSPDDITHLVITHLHPDHIAGALTPEGGAVFGKAEVIVTEADVAFWTNADNFAGAPDAMPFHQLASAFVAAYGDRVTQVSDSADIVSGVSLFGLPGHTPGHVGVRISDGAESFLHVADILHAQHLQLADPEIAIAFDADPDTARATRKRLLDELATDGALFSGGHMQGAKFARIAREGAGYALSGG